MISFGIDRLLASPARLGVNPRVGLVGHPASMTGSGAHTLDALVGAGVNVVRCFGPQHGMRGDKQDNMIESEDYVDPAHGIPVISLYGEHRRPTGPMLDGLDVILYDLQDVGCRIYTYISTLKYFLEALSGSDTRFVVLDRPNPAGRPVDGLYLESGQESFVGCDEMPTRHGLTVGELARWFVSTNQLDVALEVIDMAGYDPAAAPGYGWPALVRPWVNPSPNAASLNMARCFGGTVLLEGTELSEGRGTTTPLELIGAPGLPVREVLDVLNNAVPHWLEGAWVRPCHFEPTFHKHVGEMCAGIMFHTDSADYDHGRFRPYRLVAGLMKALRLVRPDYILWRHHDYEYELDRIPIDVINGGPALREWVDDGLPTFDEFEQRLDADRSRWIEERAPHMSY